MRAVTRSGVIAVGVAVAVISMSCGQPPVTYAEARKIVDLRCVECHSDQPTNRAFPFPVMGVKLDTPQQMQQYAGRIKARVVVERTMPIANMSGMTDEERAILSRWVESGARTQ